MSTDRIYSLRNKTSVSQYLEFPAEVQGRTPAHCVQAKCYCEQKLQKCSVYIFCLWKNQYHLQAARRSTYKIKTL